MSWQRVYAPKSEFALPAYTFDVDREQCRRCAHVSIRLHTSKVTGQSEAWNCKLASRQGANEHGACSVMRLPGGACGPEATLFEERQ